MNIRTYIFLGLLSLVMRVQAERNISSPLFLDLVNRIDNNYSEDEVISRLQGMYCLVDLKIEDDVIDQVKRYIITDRGSSRRILYRKDLYFPLMDKLFIENDLPIELKHLAAIESALNPSAKSSVGAAGLWQLMPGTAKIRGLKIDHKVDQRMDAVVSTVAAIKYFKTLYQIFGDWTLVLAAYNCGENRVLDVMEKTGSKDFWTIRKFLPRQTQLFVPAFIGVSYMLQFYYEHNLVPEVEEMPANLLSFAKVTQEINIHKMLKATGIDKETFENFNPSYQKLTIPGEAKGQYIALPDSQMVSFVDYYMEQLKSSPLMKKDTAMNQSLNENASDSVLVEVISFSRPFNFPPEDIVEKQTQEIPNDYMADASVSDVPTPEIEWTTDYKYHIIRSRESLSDIATLYDKVSVDELMYWNELSPESSLKVGSVLVIKK